MGRTFVVDMGKSSEGLKQNLTFHHHDKAYTYANMLNSQFSEVMVHFLDQDYHTLLFYLNQKEELLPAITFPSFLKKKSIYFLKSQQIPAGTPLTADVLDKELTMGDLSANPLEFLSTLLEEVYLPLLTNPKNLESWPEVVANDVLRHFHQLNGAVYVISGKSKV
jgi:dynein heavy chain